LLAKFKNVRTAGGWSEYMGKLALVATIKTVPGKRDEYLDHLRAHSRRYLATEPGTLKFEIMVPHDEADTVILYEVYASPEAFETHWRGPAKREANRDLEPLRVRATAVRCDLVE
jgi:quinol monooxygenase YgiN